MYKTINTHEGLKPIADTFIMENDRNLYRPFFECAEEYASIHRMVLGGTISVDLLIGAPFTRNSFFWEFYCDNTFLNARGLAEAISRTRSTHIPARTTALVTNIKHREFAISVNARMLFKIYSLDKYRGVNLINIIKPIICGSYFKNIQIQCIPEYMQLINIYRTLYTPGKVALWKSAFDAEKELWARTLQINGGRDNNRGNKWRDNNRGGNKWRDNNRGGNKWRDNNRGNKWRDNGGEARADDGIIIE